MKKPQPRSFAREFGIPRELLLECATRGHALLTAGCFDEAIVMARGLVAADEENTYSRTLLATALFRQGNRDEALAVLDAGLAAQPANAELRCLRTRLLTAPKPTVDSASRPSTSTYGRGPRSAVAPADPDLSTMFFHSLRC